MDNGAVQSEGGGNGFFSSIFDGVLEAGNKAFDAFLPVWANKVAGEQQTPVTYNVIYDPNTRQRSLNDPVQNAFLDFPTTNNVDGLQFTPSLLIAGGAIVLLGSMLLLRRA